MSLFSIKSNNDFPLESFSTSGTDPECALFTPVRCFLKINLWLSQQLHLTCASSNITQQKSSFPPKIWFPHIKSSFFIKYTVCNTCGTETHLNENVRWVQYFHRSFGWWSTYLSICLFITAVMEITTAIERKENTCSFLSLMVSASAYLTELTLSSVVDGGTIGHTCQVVEGVHAGS